MATIPPKAFSLKMDTMLALTNRLPNQSKDLSSDKHRVFEHMVQFSSLDVDDIWKFYLEPLTKLNDVRIPDTIPLLENPSIWGILDEQVKKLRTSFFGNLFLLDPRQLDTIADERIQELITQSILTLEAASNLNVADKNKLTNDIFFTNLLDKQIIINDTKLLHRNISMHGMREFILNKNIHRQVGDLLSAVKQSLHGKSGEKYSLLLKLGNYIASNDYNDYQILALHLKNYLYLALQRDFPGFSNKTSTGSTIKTLLNTEKYQDLRHILFGDNTHHVLYRQIRRFVCGTNNEKLFGFSKRSETYRFFRSSHPDDVMVKSEEKILAHIRSSLN